MNYPRIIQVHVKYLFRSLSYYEINENILSRLPASHLSIGVDVEIRKRRNVIVCSSPFSPRSVRDL